jgi:two-component system, NtrC family, sensor kinase
MRIKTHLTLCALQTSLQQKNQDLEQTLHQLQITQDQLIQSEKMAALGQLVAGVAHEMNTPLGAIRSSVENITHVLGQSLEPMFRLFQSLSAERQQDVLQLLSHSTQPRRVVLSSREKRQFKKELIQQIGTLELGDGEAIADTLVDIGVYQNIQPFIPLLQAPNRQSVLDLAYQLTSLQRSAQTIATGVDLAAKVVFALRSYSHQNIGGEKLEADVITGLETALTLYQNHLKSGIEIVKNYTELPPILCFPDELNQVWMNLIHNALQAMAYQGRLILSVSASEQDAIVSITDSGRGVSQEVLPRIFEPFFTTKPMGEGTGLGLSIVKKIIDKHNGKIQVSSIPGHTTFCVCLPLGRALETL